jgi:hypothetical protein
VLFAFVFGFALAFAFSSCRAVVLLRHSTVAQLANNLHPQPAQNQHLQICLKTNDLIFFRMNTYENQMGEEVVAVLCEL